MAYTKNTWADGDIVTSEKLNHMEDGIANADGIMVINDTDDTFDKTWQEIYDAIGAGTLCVVRRIYNTMRSIDIVASVSNTGNRYVVNMDSDDRYEASSSTGYPTITTD